MNYNTRFLISENFISKVGRYGMLPNSLRINRKLAMQYAASSDQERDLVPSRQMNERDD